MASSSTNYASVVKQMKQTFISGETRTLAWREHQLNQLIKMMEENVDTWKQAQINDLKQTEPLISSEVNLPIKEAKFLKSNLKSLIKPQEVSVNAAPNLPGEGFLVREPYGVVLIISPWNYPISLLAVPLAGALAAGNLVIIKPSEVSESCSKTFAELIPKYFDSKYVKCVCGDAEETKSLLNEHFDYIFYTGSTSVGRHVMTAAAKHLTPVTLELGGKSPLIMDSTVDIGVASKRLTWGKFLNCGQTCVAPDYLLLESKIAKRFIESFKSSIKTCFGEDASQAKDYPRIINKRHVARLKSYIEPVKDKIIFGGDIKEEEHYVSPTLILNPDIENDLIMKEEIFGPVLPIIIYGEQVDSEYPSLLPNVDAAIEYINNRDKPLALYIFSRDQKFCDHVINVTQSGAVGINETVTHFLENNLPFGGIGASGIGAYHGKATFETFSHVKPILKKKYWLDLDVRYPPYTKAKQTQLDLLLSENFLTSYLLPIGAYILYLFNKLFK
ncbi:hypothetical protein ABK040_005733 [Willaertia magna]